jgi:adenylate cyclase
VKSQHALCAANGLPASGPGATFCAGAGLVARGYREATLLCADVAGLPGLARALRPEKLVAVLDGLFSLFEGAARRHGLSSVAVRSGAFAAVAGVPDARPDHARAAAEMALELLSASWRLLALDGRSPALRIGLHSGPVVAAMDVGRGGVRELWGDAARVARLLEARGIPGLVQVSAATASRLAGGFRLEARSRTPGVATAGVETFFLAGRRAA